jgi:hypothetical protein
MFLKTEIEIHEYQRPSKLGHVHVYKRKKTFAVLRCDNCNEVFRKELKLLTKKRCSNNYFHCCSNCDAKRFAQRKGVERKKIWDMPASLNWPVGKF